LFDESFVHADETAFHLRPRLLTHLQIFGSIPSEGAEYIGADASVQAIYAKFMSVRMLSMLGFDFLYQDVDVMWYKDPMAYFSKLNDEYDIYFMEDGARWRYYAPYFANAVRSVQFDFDGMPVYLAL